MLWCDRQLLRCWLCWGVWSCNRGLTAGVVNVIGCKVRLESNQAGVHPDSQTGAVCSNSIIKCGLSVLKTHLDTAVWVACMPLQCRGFVKWNVKSVLCCGSTRHTFHCSDSDKGMNVVLHRQSSQHISNVSENACALGIEFVMSLST